MQADYLHRFLPLPEPYTLADARTYIEDISLAHRRAGTALECGLTERTTGRLVGTAALFLPAGRTLGGEIGYAVYPAGRGRGYAAEATRALARWGFGAGLQRIELRVAVANIWSARAALRAGFRYEGVARQSIAVPGGLGDAVIFARAAGDAEDPVVPALPELPGGRLSDGVVAVRQAGEQDAEALLAEAADPESRRWALSPLDPDRVRLAAVRAPLDWLTGPSYRMVIVDAAGGETAGTLNLFAAGPPGCLVVGYGLLPQFRGRGFTVRALRLLVDWAFGPAGLARLELGAAVENVASQKVAVRAGFQPDGLARARLRRPDGSYADEARYALINPRLLGG
jgi:RimJ/RimL family protein N-acetyltransferase